MFHIFRRNWRSSSILSRNMKYVSSFSYSSCLHYSTKKNKINIDEWQQYKDKKSPTGYIYRNTYTRETMYDKPKDGYIPYEHLESPWIRFFKTDSFADRGEPITKKYWQGVAIVLLILLIYDVSQGYHEFNLFSQIEEQDKVGSRRIVKILKKKKLSSIIDKKEPEE